MSWDIVKAQDVMDIRDGTHDSPKYYNAGYPLITSKNLKYGGIDFSNVSFISKGDYDAINRRSRVTRGDIIFAMIGTVGNPVLVDIEPDFAIKNVALFRFNGTKVCNKFILFLLKSDFIKFQLGILSRGGTQKFVSLTNLRELKIPLPPLPIQKKIAAVLEKADGLRRKREQQIKRLDDLQQAIFLDMFGDPVTNPKGWEKVKLVDVIDVPAMNGFFAKKKDYGHGCPIIWISDFLNKFYVNIDGVRKVQASKSDIEKYKLKYGDALFCRSSLTVDGIGKASIIPPEIHSDCIFECHVIKLSFDVQRLLPEYFKQFSETNYFRAQIMKSAKTSTMTTISQDGILKTHILIPPIEQQKRFLQFAQKLLSEKCNIERGILKNNNLFNSLMQRAFNGELDLV